MLLRVTQIYPRALKRIYNWSPMAEAAAPLAKSAPAGH